MKNKILLYKINIFLFTLLQFYKPNIYSQTLTAEQIYKKVNNAVVVVHAYDEKNVLTKQGSGVVINDKGYVVTNYHVLSGCDRLELLHNKEVIPYVDIIGIDVEKDVLILKIDAKKFPAIKIGDSKKLNIGQRVYAIGSPLGFENTISEGIISGLRNYGPSEKNFIQITASISSGSSGGAVVNHRGELIGISTLTATEGQNINFAIPINNVLSVKISSYSKNDAFKDFEFFSKGYDATMKGNDEEAVRCYSIFIHKYPNDAHAYYNRGLSKVGLGDFIGAIQDYNIAIEINPNDEKPYFSRGAAKGAILDYQGAIQDYNKAIEINPDYAVAYNNRGSLKSDLGDYRGAIQDFNKSIETNSNNYNAYNNRGITKKTLGDYNGAIQDYNKAIEIDPNNADAYQNRGIAKFRLGDKYGACLDLSKAGELGSDSAYDLIRKYCN